VAVRYPVKPAWASRWVGLATRTLGRLGLVWERFLWFFREGLS